MAENTDADQAAAISAMSLARRKLNSANFLASVSVASDAERNATGRAILDMALANQRLRGARLESIANKLDESRVELKAATKGLNKAVEDLTKIKPILDGITAILKVVAQIVSLVP